MVTNELRKLREKSGLTQKQLADAAGVSQGAISQSETGVTQLSPATLEHVIRALRLNRSERQKLIILWFEEVAGI